MTDASIIAIVTVIGTLLTTISTGVIAILTSKQKYQAEAAARSRANIATVVAATHTLVNSASLVQLRINALLSKRIAAYPDATAEDKEAALVAEELYQEHKSRQGQVDKFPAVAMAMKEIQGEP